MTPRAPSPHGIAAASPLWHAATAAALVVLLAPGTFLLLGLVIWKLTPARGWLRRRQERRRIALAARRADDYARQLRASREERGR